MTTFLFTSQALASPFPFKTIVPHPTMDSFLLPRIGRNSKVMLHDSTPEVQEEEFTTVTSVEDLLKDLEEQLEDFKTYSDSEDDNIVNDLADQMIAEALEGKIPEQKDREFRAKEGNFDIEHTFNLHEDEQIRRSRLPQQPRSQQPLQQPLPQPLSQPRSQPESEFPVQYQPRQQSGQIPVSSNLQYPPRQQPGQVPDINRGQYSEQYPANLPSQQTPYSQGNSQQYQPQSQASPRQIEESTDQQQSGLPETFGVNMGTDLLSEPEENQYPTSPQLSPSRQAQDAAEEEEEVEEKEEEEEEVRCINKVMQVTSTVYEDKIKCQHTFTEKCHDTFITDYVPTQEKKCETSFDKNCHITYKPMMFEETVKICDEPLKKVCNNDTVGQGEEVCKTHYETTCETRYKEHEVEQDEPVCTMVTERKCKDVSVPVPDSDPTGTLLRRTRRRAQEEGLDDNTLQSLDLDNPDDFLNVGEECEDWPVQKCTLEKKTVKKTNPETSCRKMPREICAPGNCVFKGSEQVCREENKQFLQNIPSEVCDLEPREDCKMETVLVPRLIQQPNCIKVPKEVCINAKTNPKKVKKPVVKEWCYKPSDLKSPSTRLALSQFFSN